MSLSILDFIFETELVRIEKYEQFSTQTFCIASILEL